MAAQVLAGDYSNVVEVTPSITNDTSIPGSILTLKILWGSVSLHKYIWMCFSALILIQKLLSMASCSLKMRRLLARGGESLQLWSACANPRLRTE